jgi:hypothetical protein
MAEVARSLGISEVALPLSALAVGSCEARPTTRYNE